MADLGLIDFKIGLYIIGNVTAGQNKFGTRTLDKSNYNELTMLPKAAIIVLGSFRETRETVNTQRKLETPKFKHSALGLKFRLFSGEQPICPGGL